MMFKIIKDGALRKLYYAVGSTGLTTPRKLVTHEQVRKIPSTHECTRFYLMYVCAQYRSSGLFPANRTISECMCAGGHLL